MADGYGVDPNLLREAASGINATIGELKTLGIAEAADEGRGFDGLALTGMQLGNQNLTSALRDFTDRWGWGVRSMVREGDKIAELVGLSAGSYHDMEQYAVGVLKDAFNAVAGDPHATEQQVENSSFGQIVAADQPDLSAASWARTGQDVTNTWLGVAADQVPGPNTGK